jgi:peptidoglycan/LPS O-acetylase OafA/YrhL
VNSGQTTGAAQERTIAYRPEIDGLRAIAVVAVMVWHAELGFVAGGFLGVDIFFVISGFLITLLITAECETRRFNFIRFYYNRARRLLPALLVMLIASVPVVTAIFPPEQTERFAQSFVASLLFCANIFFRLNSGYFDDIDTMPLLHLWSLSLEIQFYLVFPPLLVIALRYGQAIVGVMFGSLCVISFVYMLYKQPLEPMGAFYLPQSRFWEFLLGGLAAYYAGPLSDAFGWNKTVQGAASMAALVAVLVPLIYVTNTLAHPGWITVVPVVGTAILLITADKTTMVGKVLALRALAALGILAYGAYLWHQPLFVFAREWWMRPLPPAAAYLLIFVSFVLAAFSRHFIEKPIRLQAKATSLAALTLCLMTIGLIAVLTNGVPQRFSPESRKVVAQIERSPLIERCNSSGASYRPPSAACRYFGSDVEWAVLGDSHSLEVGFVIAEHLRPSGKGIVHYSFNGCPPAFTYASNVLGCDAWVKDAVDAIETEKGVTNVLLAYRHDGYLFGDQRTALLGGPKFLYNLTPDQARLRYWEDFVQLSERLIKAGKRVTVMLPVPALPVMVNGYIYRFNGADMSIPVEDYELRNAFLLSHIKTLADISGITIIDPRNGLCKGGRCYAVENGHSYYFDDHHISLAGARAIIAAYDKTGLLP